MSLLTIFYVVCGVSALGIILAIWLYIQESLRTKEEVQKIAPEDVKQYDPSTETLGSEGQDTSKKATKKGKKPRVSLQGLFGNKKGEDTPIRLDAIEAAPDAPESKPKKKSLLSSLSFGKSKPSPLDDIPKPTTFPGLHAEESIKSPNSSQQGTAAMTTGIGGNNPNPVPPKQKPPIPKSMANPSKGAQPVLPIEQELQETKSAATGHQEASSQQREHLATAQLDEWKQKYERLDKLFQEKSNQFSQAESELANEKQNRDDFFKLKTILENEIQEVKDRARDLQNTLKNAQMETEQQKVQAQQLRDKVKILEDEIQINNSQITEDKDVTTHKDPPPGLPLSKLIEQNEREEAARKDSSPDQNPVVNLPQDQNPSAGDIQQPGSHDSANQTDQPHPDSNPQSEDKRF